jgi:ribosome-binding factor A
MLKGKCFFPLLKLIKKVDLKQDIKNLTVNVTGKTAEEKKAITDENGLELIFIIVDKIEGAEKETWDFMTLYLEKSIEEVKEMDIFEIAEIISELIKDKRVQTVFHKAIS